VPFAGSVMAFFSVLLMTAFLQQWKQKGIIWRAGLIAALMKSLSPSAFLLGPMTGIFLEALFFELSVSIMGLRIYAYLIGGGLSLLSALIHKLINLLILYGRDFITIYKNMLAMAFRQLNDAGLILEHVLLGLAALYALAGMLAAFLGIMAGKSIAGSPVPSAVLSFRGSPETEQKPVQAKRSLLLLAIHLLTIPMLLYINHQFRWYISLAAAALYTGWLIRMYPVVFKRLSKPMLWIQFVFLMLLSFLFLGTYSPETGFMANGLISGVRMNVRALLVIAGFAAIGFELRHEKIRDAFLAYGNADLYQSLSISFNLLPAFLQHMNSPRMLILHPFVSIRQMLAGADHFFLQLQKKRKTDIN
jgi:hypothetical protein